MPNEKSDRRLVAYLSHTERDGWHDSLLDTRSIYLDGDVDAPEFAAILKD